MPVEFSCDGCNRRLRAPDAKAGKRTNCPTCGKELQIPVMNAGPQLSLPPAGAAPANPLDLLAAIIPSASEAAAGFNLSQPQTGPAPLTPIPSPPAPAPKPAPSQPIEIGLADDADLAPTPSQSLAAPSPNAASPSASSSGSTSSSGIGGSLKPKPNAWRGGDKMPPTPGAAPKPAAPHPAMPNAPQPNAQKPNAQKPGPAKPSMPNLVIPSAPKPAAPAPASPLSLPMATAAPVSPLVPVAPMAPTAPNPLDDIFKDLPQLAPVSAPAPQPFPSSGPMFGGLTPIAAADPFQSQGAALPTTVPNWSQVASTANVGGGNPYAAPSMGASAGYRRNSNIESVRTIVLIPGVFLIVTYTILLILYAVQAVVTVVGGIALFSTNQVDEEQGGWVVFQMALAVICFLLAIAGLFGAIKMVRLRSRSAALTASILAIFPFYFCLPIGIWAVIVLSMENVRSAFEANDRRAERGM